MFTFGIARKRAIGRAPLAVICALSMLLATFGATAAATGPASHAEVIAQGVAPLSANSMAWRVVLRQPDPAEEHPPIARHLGFTLVHQGALLVTGYERKNDLTMLSPGEATFAREGDIQGR